jgi:cytoskeletal protein RodZ
MTRLIEEEHHDSGPLGFSGTVAKSIAERLVAARVQKGLTVQELSKRVRIREHFTQVIESGDWSSLPAGLNGRGLIRLCARELGVRVPELDPSAHLTEGNARVELAEQAHAYDAIREHTIRTMKPGAVANPVERGAPPGMVRPAQRGSVGARHISRSSGSDKASLNQRAWSPHANGRVGDVREAPQEGHLDDVVSPNIEDVLGLNVHDEAASVERITTASMPVAPLPDPGPVGGSDGVSEGFATETEDPEDVPPVDVFGSLGMDLPSSEPPKAASVGAYDHQRVEATPQAESPDRPMEQLFAPAPAPVPLGLIDDRTGSFVSDARMTEPTGIVRGEAQAALAERGQGGRRRRKSKMGLMVAAGLVVLVFGGVFVAIVQQRNSSIERAVSIRDLSPSSASSESSSVANENSLQSAGGESAGIDAGALDVSRSLGQSVSVEAAGDLAPTSDGSASGVSLRADGGVASDSGDEGLGQTPGEAPLVGERALPQAAVDTIGTGSSRARLRIVAPVELQVRADGQVVLSGLREAGEVELLFNRKAEILAGDGSLVDLEYAGWEHGKLGHDGRRRRLILQATPFKR